MKDQDRDEFERVFRSAYRSVLQTAFLVLQDRGRAEEVTQDAFLRLYERWGDAVTFEHPTAWVRRVVVRDAIRRARRERVVPVRSLTDTEAAGDRLPDIDLLRAVGGLPPKQRAAVALHYLEDLPVDQVAALMEVAPATVRQHPVQGALPAGRATRRGARGGGRPCRSMSACGRACRPPSTPSAPTWTPSSARS